MSRRLLSTAVEVRPAPKDLLAIPSHLIIQTLQPTPSEVRDALARVVVDLEYLRLKRGPTWDPVADSLGFRVDVLDNGQIVLRGTLIIERPDA